ncbi:MAG: hypothetical protein D4R45_07305 [Planctomycetaceae bacterium]|nr:MAG: hypothetical protein D4R45_07305 [Planctomycetaceae bacterium]
MATEAQELETLEKIHGDADLSEFENLDDDDDSQIGGAKSEEFVDVEEMDKGKKEPEKKSDSLSKTTELKNPDDWDKHRQELNQTEANFRKTQEKLESAEARLARQDETIKSMQDKLDAYTKANEIDLDEIDPQYVDPSVIKVLKAMQAKLDLAEQRSKTLEESRDQIKEDLRKQSETNRREQSSQEIITDIEQEYPARYRNAAIAEANRICTERGYPPSDRYESAKLLRSCYKKLADADSNGSKTKTTPKTPTVPTDTGRGGGTNVVAEDNKPMTLKERANYWRQRLKSK